MTRHARWWHRWQTRRAARRRWCRLAPLWGGWWLSRDPASLARLRRGVPRRLHGKEPRRARRWEYRRYRAAWRVALARGEDGPRLRHGWLTW